MKNNLQGLLKINLQLLAEDSQANGSEASANKESSADGKAYTDEELKNLIQSEADKRVTQALETSRVKWEKEYQEKLEKEKTEAQKLAKMSADERAKAEFEKKEAELQKREKEIIKKELQAQARDELSEKGLPSILVDLLNYDSADTVKESMDSIAKIWEEAVQRGVSERIKGDKPLPGAQENKEVNIFDQRIAKYK